MAYINGDKILFSSNVKIGGFNVGEKNITANGTYNASDDNLDGYSSVSVNVEGSGTDRLQWKCDNVKSLRYEFAGYQGSTLDEILNGLDTSKVESMEETFYSCSQLTSLDLSNFDTSSVKNMHYMLAVCSQLTSLDLSNFNTSNVTNMNSMFYSCSQLTSLDLSNFDTSSVTDMYAMFYSCPKLTGLDLSNFNTSNVTNTAMMFRDCPKLTSILGVIDMIKVNGVSNMFTNCAALTTVTLKNIKKTLQIGSGTTYGHLLTLDTLINTIKELWDYSSDTTTYTLTMGTANLEKIANTYVKLITPTEEMIAADPNIESKMPCEVCESTDEGAMTLTAYASSKNWEIA